MDCQKVLGSQAIIHILDDFFVVASTESACRKQLHKFLTICEDLGVRIAEGKTFGPLTTLQFAGITLNSITMQASLPEDKLAKMPCSVIILLSPEMYHSTGSAVLSRPVKLHLLCDCTRSRFSSSVNRLN